MGGVDSARDDRAALKTPIDVLLDLNRCRLVKSGREDNGDMVPFPILEGRGADRRSTAKSPYGLRPSCPRWDCGSNRCGRAAD